jgi:hypothetical protein
LPTGRYFRMHMVRYFDGIGSELAIMLVVIVALEMA